MHPALRYNLHSEMHPALRYTVRRRRKIPNVDWKYVEVSFSEEILSQGFLPLCVCVCTCMRVHVCVRHFILGKNSS